MTKRKRHPYRGDEEGNIQSRITYLEDHQEDFDGEERREADERGSRVVPGDGHEDYEKTSAHIKRRKAKSQRREGKSADLQLKKASPSSAALKHTDYTVGWICALPKEQTAAIAMLDRKHISLPKPVNDHNTYTLGTICNHHVVITCLPLGQIGNNSSAAVAARMASTFPSIKFGLMVGIGGGIPPKVRLGDVVVSTPKDGLPGVVQWDMGKAEEGGSFKRTGSLNNPPSTLLTGLSVLKSEHEMSGSRIPEYLDDLRRKWPRLAPRYLRSGSLQDSLFRSDYSHETSIDAEIRSNNEDEDDDEDESCRSCDKTKTIKRKNREMKVHYGLIAAGNQVIKDAPFRDKVNKNLGGDVLCVEMEAAGLMNDFPCVVIRGICDYADSHKNKAWQEHAAAVAAAFAKELLSVVPEQEVAEMLTIEGQSPLHTPVLSFIECNLITKCFALRCAQSIGRNVHGNRTNPLTTT